MNQARMAEPGATVAPAEPSHPAETPEIRRKVVAYWRRLKVADPALLESLTADCLSRAKRRIGPTASPDELLLRALEEAERQFDRTLARALRLTDGHARAAARAALLAARDLARADELLRTGALAPELEAELRRRLPRATPPEAPLAMPEASLRFWLFRSTPR
ncbi:hypothetical protein [Candidatus Methylocalor cossyra]|uniref:Uncharacterized protein n=1 Tax=Candidatus Methylocalor cossyra TaxID=3108543 RepID=A0ABM9NIE5_9GAMM